MMLIFSRKIADEYCKKENLQYIKIVIIEGTNTMEDVEIGRAHV